MAVKNQNRNNIVRFHIERIRHMRAIYIRVHFVFCLVCVSCCKEMIVHKAYHQQCNV